MLIPSPIASQKTARSTRNTTGGRPGERIAGRPVTIEPQPFGKPIATLQDQALRRPIESAQFTSWALSDRLRTAGIAPSMGSVGTAADNAMMESFWGRLQVELLNRRRWKTRIELATGIHDYIQFHNARRRHSALAMRTPSEVEAAWVAAEQHGAVVKAGCARTAPTVLIDESAPTGLSDPRPKPVDRTHQHLLLNNNHAA